MIAHLLWQYCAERLTHKQTRNGQIRLFRALLRTRNQNKQPTPLVLLSKEDSALSHKQPVSGQLQLRKKTTHS